MCQSTRKCGYLVQRNPWIHSFELILPNARNITPEHLCSSTVWSLSISVNTTHSQYNAEAKVSVRWQPLDKIYRRTYLAR